MKKAVLKAAAIAAFAAGASGAYAQTTVSVLNNVNQNQNASNVYQHMFLGNMVTNGAAAPAAIARAFSNGTISQTQNGTSSRQAMYLGSVIAGAGSTADTLAYARNINQTQAGFNNEQRMTIGTVGVNPVTGGWTATNSGTTRVFVLGTVNQTQSAAVSSSPQRMAIGSIW